MFRKSLVLLISTCIVCSLAGCNSSGESKKTAKSKDGKKTVTFYSWSEGAEQDADKAVVTQFEKANPEIDVVENYVPYGEYLSKMNTMAAADSMPNVFKIPEGNVLEWGAKGALLDLAPLYEAEGINIDDEVLNNAIFKLDDNIWGGACNIATLALYYNPELFKAAGVELPPTDVNNPWSWEEYVIAAKELTTDKNGKHPGEEGFDGDNVSVYGTMMPTDWSLIIPLLYSNDSGIASEDGKKLEINSEKGIEVIQSIADLSLIHQAAPNIGMAKGAFSDKSTMVMNGQVAMIMDGAWAYSNYAKEGFKIAVTQIPMFSHPANMSWTAGICMSPKDVENKEAFEFFKYYTNFNNAIAAANETGSALGGLPHTKAVYDGGENQKNWIATYKDFESTDNCETFKNILYQENTRLGENVILKNFPLIVENKIVAILDKIWLGEQTADEAFKSLDVAADLQGVWK